MGSLPNAYGPEVPLRIRVGCVVFHTHIEVRLYRISTILLPPLMTNRDIPWIGMCVLNNVTIVGVNEPVLCCVRKDLRPPVFLWSSRLA